MSAAAPPTQPALLPQERPALTPICVKLSELHLERLVAPEPSRELIASITKLGVLAPPLVVKRPGGERTGYDVRDGKRRAKAAAAAGLEEIPAILVPAGVSPEVLTLVGNRHRSSNEAADHLALQDLRTRGYEDEQIASAVNVGKSTLKAMRVLENLPAELRALAVSVPPRISLGVAKEISRLSRPQQLVLLDLYKARVREAALQAAQDATKPGTPGEPTLTLADVKEARTAHRQAVVGSLAEALGLVQGTVAGDEVQASVSPRVPAPDPTPGQASLWTARIRLKVREALALVPPGPEADATSRALHDVLVELAKADEQLAEG